MPSSACDVIGFATQRNRTTGNDEPDSHMPVSDLALSDAPDEPIDRHRRAHPSERVGAPLPAHRPNGSIDGHGRRMQRRLALAIARTTPTLLPEMLRTLSKQAGHLASHPVNAFDDNPFIMREWLIVSQVLHATAQTLENRFEALFLGL